MPEGIVLGEKGLFGFLCFTKDLEVNRKKIVSWNFGGRDVNVECDRKSEKITSVHF